MTTKRKVPAVSPGGQNEIMEIVSEIMMRGWLNSLTKAKQEAAKGDLDAAKDVKALNLWIDMVIRRQNKAAHVASLAKQNKIVRLDDFRDMARDHKAGGKVEPHATRMDELSGALLARSFRQDERPALALAHGHGSRSMDTAALGHALPDHSGALRTLPHRTRAPSQKADRFCSPSHSSGSAMGAEAQDRRRRRLQFRGTRSDRRGSPSCLSRHAAAARREPLRASA